MKTPILPKLIAIGLSMVIAGSATYGTPVRADDDNETATLSESDQLAIAALRSLISAPPEQALPRLRKVLEGQRNEEVKVRAIFVLAQIELPEAATLLADTARAGKGRVQVEAIRALGIQGQPAGLDIVRQLARTGEVASRRAARDAMIIAEDKIGLVQVAEQATEESDRRGAIDALAAIGAVDELRGLAKSGKVTRNLITALAISGDRDSLLAIARGNEAIGTRAEAIGQLGLIDDEAGRAALRGLWTEVAEPKLKRAVLQGMIIGSDSDGLLTLYRQEKDLELKRELLRALSITGGDAAMDAIDAAIEGQTP